MVSRGTVEHWQLDHTRRQFIGRSAALGATALGGMWLAGCGSDDGSASGGRPFILADWGGNTARIRRETWGTAFTKETGRPTTSTALDYGKFKAQVESGKVQWNWIDAEGWFALGNPDLFAELPYDDIGVEESDVYPLKNAYTPRAVMSYHSCYAIGHRTDGDRKAPTDWVEFFDTKAVPGKRAVFNWPYGTVELALIADGVAYEELYPLDLDRAFTKLDSIRDDMIFWNSGAESQQFLVSGSADFVQAWHNRVATVADTGAAVGVQWGQNLQIITHHTISKHQPDPEACATFIKTAFEPEPLSQYAAASFNSPPTKAAYDLLGDETKKWMSTNPEYLEQSVGVIDDEWWGKNLEQVSTAWTEWASG